jgi:Tol biopolymer transport system component
MSASADGNSLVTVQTETAAGLESASLDATTWTPVTPVTTRADGLFGVALLPDDRVVYTAFGGGWPHLWISAADGSNVRQLTTTRDRIASDPAAGPDGRWIYVQWGNPQGSIIARVAVDGSGFEEITHGGSEANAIVSADGRSIYGASTRGGSVATIKVAVDGGPVTVIANGFTPVSISRDGKRLFGVTPDENFQRLLPAFLHQDTGVIERVTPGIPIGPPPRSARLLPDDGILFLPTSAGPRQFMKLKNGHASPVGPPIDDEVFAFNVSPDGQRVLVSHGRVSTNVLLLSAK